MSMEDARKQLGIGDKDLGAIKNAKDSSWVLVVLFGAVLGIAAFVTGYAVGREIGPGYPYSSISVASVAGAGRRGTQWVIVLLLAVLAVFSFDFGILAQHPTYGEGSYYGVYCRKT
jgi:hypothetical protein